MFRRFPKAAYMTEVESWRGIARARAASERLRRAAGNIGRTTVGLHGTKW